MIYALIAAAIWVLPHAVGLVLLATVYLPRSVGWRDGAIEVVVRWRLIPRGLGENFHTGAQTHGLFIFYRNEKEQGNERLGRHERQHVRDGTIGGAFYMLAYGVHFLVNLARGMSTVDAYWEVWFERRARAAE